VGRTWHRLKRRPEFLDVAATGLRRATPGFVIQAKPLSTGPLRIGFTASRKVGNAVARNRAKRRLRALVDKVVPQLGLESWDLVLIARTEATVRDFDTMADDFSRAVVKVTTERGKERRA
jgi:ribonuclease P protein component